MAIIKKELKTRGVYTGLLLAIGTFLLNGNIKGVDIGKLGVIPTVIAGGLVQLLMSFMSNLKDKNKKEINLLTKKIAFFIATIQAFLIHSSPAELSLQVVDSMLLAEISDQITTCGIGYGLSTLFIIQLLKDAFKQSRVILESNNMIHLASIGGLMIPLVLFTSLYHDKEEKLEINTKKKDSYTTHQLGNHISITKRKDDYRKSYLPMRVAACGTMPIMHSLSLFIFLGLSPKWLWTYGVLLVFMYVIEMLQSVNSFEIARQLKNFGYTIKGIRPGEETRKCLTIHLKKAIKMGIPLILVMGFYPFIFLKNSAAFSLARSVPFLVCEGKNILREIESYNLDFKSKGAIVC